MIFIYSRGDTDGSGENSTVCTSAISHAFSLFFYHLAEIVSLDTLSVCEGFILEVPKLNFRSPDVVIKTYGYVVPDLRAVLVRMTS